MIILSILLRYLLVLFHLRILQFPKGDVPEWVCNAMEVAGIDISSCCAPLSSCQEYDSKNVSEEFIHCGRTDSNIGGHDRCSGEM